MSDQERIVSDPDTKGWEANGTTPDGTPIYKWSSSGGNSGGSTGAGMVISPTPPTEKVTGMQWLNSTTAEVFIWDEDKWVEMPGGVDGADGVDGVDGLWTDNGNGSIEYTGTMEVNGDLLAAKADAGTQALAIGFNAGATGQKELATAVGRYCGETNQGIGAFSAGSFSGNLNQGNYGVGIGYKGGSENQGDSAVAIGQSAAETDQGTGSIAIGFNSGRDSQGSYSLGIGSSAGNEGQGENAVAIGRTAGQIDQSNASVAVGHAAGKTTQGFKATALGVDSGYQNQGDHAIAIGNSAGRLNQGQDSIAIGRVAAKDNQAPNGIIICSGGVEENNTNQHHIVIRSGPGKFLYYNGTDNWKFSGGSVSGISFRQSGAPVIDAKDLINTLSTLHRATMDETKDIRESLRSAIEELVEGFEQEIATMPTEDSE